MAIETAYEKGKNLKVDLVLFILKNYTSERGFLGVVPLLRSGLAQYLSLTARALACIIQECTLCEDRFISGRRPFLMSSSPVNLH